MVLKQLYTQQPTPQQLVDYANAVLTINNYAYAITNQKLPVLQYPPANYADFATQFGPAKQHALNWTDNIFVAMIQLPVTIKEQATDLFSLEEMMIESYLNTLISDPTNATAKKNLGKALTDMQTVINKQVTTITSIQTELKQFDQDIYDDAKVLTGISQKAVEDASTDKDTIADIQKDIENLTAEIQTANTLLAVSTIGVGVSIFVGLIGAVVCFFNPAVGGGMIAVAVAGAAASITGAVVESDRIKSLQAEVDSDQIQITGLNQDVILLGGISTQFNALYNANIQAQTALTTIENMWTNLDTTIEAVKAELATVDTDNTGAQYQDALEAFQQAETNWNEVVAFAGALANITYKWQDASGNWHEFTAQSPDLDQGNVTPIPSQIPQAA